MLSRRCPKTLPWGAVSGHGSGRGSGARCGRGSGGGPGPNAGAGLQPPVFRAPLAELLRHVEVRLEEGGRGARVRSGEVGTMTRDPCSVPWCARRGLPSIYLSIYLSI
eukprot:656515-Prorocentrum_minimum.AAC.5